MKIVILGGFGLALVVMLLGLARLLVIRDPVIADHLPRDWWVTPCLALSALLGFILFELRRALRTNRRAGATEGVARKTDK